MAGTRLPPAGVDPALPPFPPLCHREAIQASSGVRRCQSVVCSKAAPTRRIVAFVKGFAVDLQANGQPLLRETARQRQTT